MSGKLYELNNVISTLQQESSVLLQEIIHDRSLLAEIDADVNKIHMHENYLSQKIQEKQRVIDEFDRMIIESEQTYRELTSNSEKLYITLMGEQQRLFKSKK